MTQIYHAHLYGSRDSKYDWLQNHDVLSTDWQELKPQTPFYLLIPQNTDLLREYEQGWKITDVMPVNSTGIKTHRDHFVIDFNGENLKQRIADFRDLQISDDEIANQYQLSDTRDWKLSLCRCSLAANQNWGQYLTQCLYLNQCLYRPFDIRAYFHHQDVVELPLTRNLDLFQKLAAYGEELVALHLMKSPRMDSPIVQFKGNPNPIVDAGHPKFLLPSPSGRGAGVEGGKVIINKKGDGFTGVPEQIWNFYVGSYQVCHKWLKDRKGRTLSPEDIIHYQRIVVALQETIRLMQQIDEAIPGFPLE